MRPCRAVRHSPTSSGVLSRQLANLGEAKPSTLPPAPRVFEKVYNGVVANGSAAPGVKGKLFRWAFREFDAYVDAKLAGRDYHSLGFSLAQRLVFSKVSRRPVRSRRSGSAPSG